MIAQFIVNIYRSQSMPLSVYSLLVFFWGALVGVDPSFANSKCDSNLNATVKWTFQRLYSSPSISLNQPICPLKKMVDKVEPENLFVTNGLFKGKNVVCISNDASNPCKFVVGSFRPNVDPVMTLKVAFGYTETIDLSKPIEESIERLLIRPADVIYPNIIESRKEED